MLLRGLGPDALFGGVLLIELCDLLGIGELFRLIRDGTPERPQLNFKCIRVAKGRGQIRQKIVDIGKMPLNIGRIDRDPILRDVEQQIVYFRDLLGLARVPRQVIDGE